MNTQTGSAPQLSDAIQLPSGAVLKNRIVKSAMSDSLGDGTGNPTAAQIRLYERWAQGGLALSVIGEVQSDPRYPEKPGNLMLWEQSDKDSLRELTARASVNGAHIWPQLGHGGALSHAPVYQPKGPSALHIGDFKCDGMTLEEVLALPETYARSAALAKEVGFTGVQIHAGHGFLLSQFLSPLFNRRDDQYGGSVAARARIVTEIITAVREALGSSFPIGIKINTSDLLEGGLTQQDALQTIKLLDETSLDLIELSGGTYFPGAKSSSDSAAKGPYYLEFAAQARQVTDIPLMVTGGFKSREEAADALSSSSTDLIGVARATILNPTLARDWQEGKGNPVFPRFETNPPGGITAWYTLLLTALANDEEADFELDLPTALRIYEERDALKTARWKDAFWLG
ncbi:NADH:flavin oxidoreductase/NADH oxidase family protein [Aliamphritea spongicola]|uniref:NADH:flavin oxidoreductase/NADH oxidase family protein n=1 Tax=Aliamphritea spongicola TaxID=707589 RepID=UPI00196AB0DD|nr:NADH:flavin oxidoreductase/NADH oxidase family protein [Aliamphritea spongicola]MBN3561164.1 NADH:flavin oxidoreductase/NADH oxidase family protein [Aliamphritea spongicola]